MGDPVNQETRSAVGNVDSDYYFDDEGAVDPGVTGGLWRQSRLTSSESPTSGNDPDQDVS